MKRKFPHFAILLAAFSFNVSAEDATSISELKGLWSSKCIYMPNSHPGDDEIGTYQKIYWRAQSSKWTTSVSIYDKSDSTCSKKKIFETTVNYDYRIEGAVVLANGIKATKISGALRGKNNLFSDKIKSILIKDGNKLYFGKQTLPNQYPTEIDSQFYFTKR